MARFKDFLIEMNNDIALAIGYAVLSFNEIETLLYEYIDILYGEDLINLIGHQSIRARVNILKKLVVQEGTDEAHINHAISLLDKIQSFADTRNAIAHNPWEIYFSAEKEQFVSSIFKYTDNKYSLDQKAVLEYTQNVNTLVEQLRTALNQFIRHGRERYKQFR